MKVLAALALALSVCNVADAGPTKITVVIHSVPEGATLRLNDARTVMGVTPVTVTYQVTGCQRMQGAEVTWTSGATASAMAFELLCASTGKHQVLMFARPVGVPGLELDTQVAYQQAMLAQMKGQTEALDYANFLAAIQPAAPVAKTSALCVARDVANHVIYVACQ